MKFAFITRHAPTTEQFELAAAQGIELVSVGDFDAFSVVGNDFDPEGIYDGVIVVHPAAALRLSSKYRIGVFENGNRAEEGERPQFYAKALHVYS